MYEIEKTFSFEAGHALKNHDGICQHPHGHSYQLTIKIQAQGLIQSGPKKNMVIDFADISAIVLPLIKEYLDHQWINDTINNDSPTAEFMATWIYEQLEDKIPGLYAIVLQETNSSKVTYIKNLQLRK